MLAILALLVVLVMLAWAAFGVPVLIACANRNAEGEAPVVPCLLGWWALIYVAYLLKP